MSFNEGLAPVENGWKWGFIDTAGNLVIPCEWDSIMWNFIDGLACVRQGDKYGLIDTTGKLVVPCEYEFDTLAYSDGHIFKIDNGYLTIEDLEGNRVF